MEIVLYDQFGQPVATVRRDYPLPNGIEHEGYWYMWDTRQRKYIRNPTLRSVSPFPVQEKSTMPTEAQKSAVAAAVGQPVSAIDWSKIDWLGILKAVLEILLTGQPQPMRGKAVKAGCEDQHVCCKKVVNSATQTLMDALDAESCCCE